MDVFRAETSDDTDCNIIQYMLQYFCNITKGAHMLKVTKEFALKYVNTGLLLLIVVVLVLNLTTLVAIRNKTATSRTSTYCSLDDIKSSLDDALERLDSIDETLSQMNRNIGTVNDNLQSTENELLGHFENQIIGDSWNRQIATVRVGGRLKDVISELEAIKKVLNNQRNTPMDETNKKLDAMNNEIKAFREDAFGSYMTIRMNGKGVITEMNDRLKTIERELQYR